MMRLMLNDRCTLMPWDVIDNVVFDVGNVLLRFDPDVILRRTLPDKEADYPRLRQLIFQGPYWPMMDRGSITGAEAVMLMSAAQPSMRPLIERVMAGWNDCLDVIDEGVQALETCRNHGKRTYALTNYADAPFAETCRKHPDIFAPFDGLAVSARLRMTKPDPRIYRHVIDAYRLDPERTLFIDDSPINVEAALDAGWQAVQFGAPGVLSAFIM